MIIIFTDGSCNVHNPRKLGGYGVYIQDQDDSEIFLCEGYENTTVSRMELRAFLMAIRWIPKDKVVEATLYGDSEYVINSLKLGRVVRWESEGWNCANVDLWKDILVEIRRRPLLKLRIKHTRGHQKDILDPINYGNAIADALANYKNFESYQIDLPLNKD